MSLNNSQPWGALFGVMTVMRQRILESIPFFYPCGLTTPRFARVTDPPVGFFLGGSSIRQDLNAAANFVFVLTYQHRTSMDIYGNLVVHHGSSWCIILSYLSIIYPCILLLDILHSKTCRFENQSSANHKVVFIALHPRRDERPLHPRTSSAMGL